MKAFVTVLPKDIHSVLVKARQSIVLTVASLILLASTTSAAGPFSNLYVFGDSLSDTGALAVIAPGACPPPPYFDCRFSNGPVWVENLAADLGVSASTAYAGGTNYAIGGQRTDQILSGQLPLFLSDVGGAADPNALYALWGGGNDFLQGFAPPVVAVDNIIASILGLSAVGAMDFLIPNLPLFDPWAFEFNALLAAGLDGLSGLKITQFDVFGLFSDITFNPLDYGFINTSEPCFTGLTLCADPDAYALWDQVHPTAAAHRIIADAALDAVSVPEPATLILFGLGLAGLGWSRRKKA